MAAWIKKKRKKQLSYNNETVNVTNADDAAYGGWPLRDREVVLELARRASTEDAT